MNFWRIAVRLALLAYAARLFAFAVLWPPTILAAVCISLPHSERRRHVDEWFASQNASFPVRAAHADGRRVGAHRVEDLQVEHAQRQLHDRQVGAVVAVVAVVLRLGGHRRAPDAPQRVVDGAQRLAVPVAVAARAERLRRVAEDVVLQ